MSRGALVLAGLAAVVLLGCPAPNRARETRIGSKLDNESVLLGELATLLIRSTGADVRHRRELGGTPVVWQALLAGEIDAYPEFTGTLAYQTLNDPSLVDPDRLREALAARGIGMTGPLGYENNYAIGVRAEVADRLGLRTISDLARHPELRLSLSAEFVRRADGWPALKRHYALPHADPNGIDHDLAYLALAAGEVDVTDVYTTEAKIDRFGVRVLEDDRRFFPRYAALFVYRLDWGDTNPSALAALKRLEGKLDEPTIRRLNAPALDKVPESVTAAGFLRDSLGVSVEPDVESELALILRHTREHLVLVAISLTAAIVVAVPLGILAARRPRLGRGVLALAGLVQTVPSFALLVLLVTVPYVGGLGPGPAITALFLYGLLPIIRNTATGLTDIPRNLLESADGIGLTDRQRLRYVELPLAARSIMAGVRTAAVITVGTATLGALIDAGGLGVPIQQGLRTNDNGLILRGALPAAGLALLTEGLFALLERAVVPRGLRLGPTQ